MRFGVNQAEANFAVADFSKRHAIIEQYIML